MAIFATTARPFINCEATSGRTARRHIGTAYVTAEGTSTHHCVEFLVTINGMGGLSYPIAFEFIYCLLNLFRNASMEPKDNRVAMVGTRTAMDG